MNDLRQINRDEWPKLINEIAEHIGDEAAMNLFVRFAGRHLHVPKTIRPDHLIASTIGMKKALVFNHIFSDEILFFPNGKRQRINIRNRRIIEAWKGGKSCADLATENQLSSRHICDIIKRYKLAEKEKRIHEQYS
jgi:hypothetical protein